MLKRLFACSLLVATFGAGKASADVSSWFYAGGGMMVMPENQGPTAHPGALQLEMGLGSPPHAPMILGGLVKTMTLFGHGTDLIFVARGASGAFVRGGFGLALDAGVYQRWWGPENSTGFIGSLILGAPLGLELAATTEQGSSVHVYGATIGIDFLRLTVYRTALRSFWPNPFPPANPDGTR